ncbi:hypothetical protein GcM3_140015, partial [Golovinomyces cichoracearum]
MDFNESIPELPMDMHPTPTTNKPEQPQLRLPPRPQPKRLDLGKVKENEKKIQDNRLFVRISFEHDW